MIKKIFEYIISKFSTVLFVGSTDILPEPLSKEKENFYVLRSMDGDVEARNILIEHNLRLVVFLAKKYDNTNTDLEDLVSIGTIGLIKGVNTYRLDKNIKLATYASRCIDNEILMYLRKTKRRKGEVSFEDNLSFDADGNELHLEDVLGTDADIVTKRLDDELDISIMTEEIKKLNKTETKEYCSCFSGQTIDFNNEEFMGCSVSAIFGGVKCDLRNAIIKDDVVINATSIFGGITIYVPVGVNVKISSTSIFGGVSDERKNKTKDSEHTIHVNTTSMFGGVEIK